MKRMLAPLFVAFLLAFGLVSVSLTSVHTVAAQEDATPDDTEATPVEDDTDTDTGEDTDTGTDEETTTDTGTDTGTGAAALPNTGAGTGQGIGGTSNWLIVGILLLAAIGVAIPFRMRRNA